MVGLEFGASRPVHFSFPHSLAFQQKRQSVSWWYGISSDTNYSRLFLLVYLVHFLRLVFAFLNQRFAICTVQRVGSDGWIPDKRTLRFQTVRFGRWPYPCYRFRLGYLVHTSPVGSSLKAGFELSHRVKVEIVYFHKIRTYRMDSILPLSQSLQNHRLALRQQRPCLATRRKTTTTKRRKLM